MIKAFDNEDIKRWAHFSGDYNGIHFDAELARKNGLRDIIIQGMLALTEAKIQLCPRVDKPSTIHFYLKEPVARDTDIHYQLCARPGGYFCSASTSDKTCITGRLKEGIPGAIARAATPVDIDNRFIHEQLMLLRMLFPDMKESWILMDAFLFSVCFKYQHGDPFFMKAKKITRQPDKSRVVTYQVDQTIILTDGIFNYDFTDLAGLTFYFQDRDIIKEDFSVYSILDYQVYYHQKLLFQSSMGSVTRASLNEGQQ
jgi:hypothetical protein